MQEATTRAILTQKLCQFTQQMKWEEESLLMTINTVEVMEVQLLIRRLTMMALPASLEVEENYLEV